MESGSRGLKAGRGMALGGGRGVGEYPPTDLIPALKSRFTPVLSSEMRKRGFFPRLGEKSFGPRRAAGVRK